MLTVTGLRKVFQLHILHGKTIPALEDVNFEIGEGVILGLVGQSGSGKSTLMKCIYRTYLATAGSIQFETESFGTVDLASAPDSVVLQLRRKELNYCSQFLQVIPRVPALEIVIEALTRRGHDRDSAIARAEQCFTQLNLPRELWDAYPSTFSGGEQQRVNIARAIVAAPRLLLVDEPTASLDKTTKDAVIDLLSQLRQQGTSILLITHDEYTLTRLADRYLKIENGRVREAIPA